MTGAEKKMDEYVEEVLRRKSIKSNLGWLRENLLPVRVVYTDIDGTMVGPMGCFFRDRENNLTLRPAKALLAALARDVDVMLVSGRHKKQLIETSRLLGCRNFIAELGTLLVYNLGRKVVLNTGDFPLDCDDVYQAMVDTGVVDFLLDRYKGLLEMHLPWSEDRDCTPLLRGGVPLEEVNTALEEAGFGRFVFVDNGVIPRKSPTLSVSELHAYHLVPKGVSKEQALKKDREYRDFKKEETVAIGDAVADLPFSETAGAFFMVRNGLEDNPHLAEEIEKRENVFVTEGRVGEGWAEVVETVLSLD